MCIGHSAVGHAILGHPLLGTGRAFGQFPFIAKQRVEVAVVPLCRVWRPSAFNAA